METNLSSWFPNQFSHQQLSYFNSLNYPFNLGLVNDNPPAMSPCANIASSNGTITEIAFSGAPYPNQSQPNQSHGWFHGLPHYHQAFDDVANTLTHEKAAYFPYEINGTNAPTQKKFLVFDQSGDQTNLFFSPGISPPVQLPCAGPKLNCDHHVKNMVETDIYQHQEPILTCEYHEKLGDDDVESEMHEDTEEINALLYSDDEYYYEDEEEASTGHSPGTMTEFEKQEWAEDDEEVGSNFGPNKRIKLSKDYPKCEDDAESSCGNEDNPDLGEKKKIKKDQIRETVSLLKSLIPVTKGNDKDTILILDEAIDYLKSLKVKAQALGVHTI